MNFTDIKTMTYIDKNVIIDGKIIEISTELTDFDAVQFHEGRTYCLEEPVMTKAILSKYQFVLDEYETKINEVIIPTLEEAKASKVLDLQNSINYEEIVIVDKVSYIGGYESAQKLDSKRRLVIESGGTVVEYIDINDNIATLSLEEAKRVCLAVANDYEVKFYQYKAKKKEINDCETIEELEDVEI